MGGLAANPASLCFPEKTIKCPGVFAHGVLKSSTCFVWEAEALGEKPAPGGLERIANETPVAESAEYLLS